jgi:predicted nuclease of predicted toxin-antitoxin system
MRLYLDDDMDANVLIRLLQEEGHEVMSPRTVAMRGAEDAAHLRYAAAHQCAVVTANVRDFLTLHQTWQDVYAAPTSDQPARTHGTSAPEHVP